MVKARSVIKLTDALSISECHDGYWLYDYTAGMNLSMRAKTERDAFVEAISYYQERTKKLKQKLKELDESVQRFIESLPKED